MNGATRPIDAGALNTSLGWTSSDSSKIYKYYTQVL